MMAKMAQRMMRHKTEETGRRNLRLGEPQEVQRKAASGQGELVGREMVKMVKMVRRTDK